MDSTIVDNPRSKMSKWLLIGSSLAIFAVVTLLFPGLTPWSPPAAANPTGVACAAHYYALDAGKESKNAFGPPISARDEITIKAQLRERRLCGADKMGDPTLTAAHYAEWSAAGLTKEKVAFTAIDSFSAQLVTNFPKWESVVSELEGLENASAFSLQSIPAGLPSLYMVPSGHSVATRQGFTVGSGTAAMFTHGTVVVRYRLDCGFQNIRGSFPGVPRVPSSTRQPTPTPTPESTPTPGSTPTPTPTPTHQTTPKCPPGQVGTPPKCLESKVPSQDPAPRGNAPVGGGLNQDPGPGTYVPPAQMQQPPAAARVNPPAPVATTPPVASTPDPAPAPAPEPQAPAPTAPAVGTSCAPGVLTC